MLDNKEMCSCGLAEGIGKHIISFERDETTLADIERDEITCKSILIIGENTLRTTLNGVKLHQCGQFSARRFCVSQKQAK